MGDGMSDIKNKAELEHAKVQSMDLENPVYTHLHIAKLLDVDLAYVQETIIFTPNFPKARICKTGKNGDISSHRTYLREDVLYWSDGYEAHKNLDRLLRQKPDGGNHELYRLFDAENKLLYVGISINALTRFTAHKRTTWWSLVTEIKIERFPNRVALELAEKIIIKAEQPCHNIAHMVTG